MFLSVFELFKIGIGPSSSHTMGPMVAAGRFLDLLRGSAFTAHGLKAHLYGSLAHTGVGHATDRAVILGLAGFLPEDYDPEAAEAALARIRATGRVAPPGLPELAFAPAEDLVFNKGAPLPGHPNGLELMATDAEGDVIVQETYYSIGGGFVVTAAEQAQVPEDNPAKSPHPYPFENAATMLAMARESGMELLVYHNPEAEEKGINPFEHGPLHTDMWKTEGLKQALDKWGFDAAFGGARRDEEKSRAKERIFSFRTASHGWDPKNQRPELWNIYNAKKNKGESIRIFPISNWTELDVWQYIHLNDIPIVPLYFAAKRPTVERDGLLLMVDDERFPLEPGEKPVERSVRFRTLGCYPLTGAVESKAKTLPEVIQETLLTTTSERQGRAIDKDAGGAGMEKKKQEGYF